ncbi:FKBP-type peptidyl-prolyl cis-trans isomerase [Pseudomonas sp. RIT-PI-S]|uniref:FKBP-type peptidyl-prolyl cis-trans isomerase n=1 Tax=Pseudomonas sp. RIT-PI-S TaxID=3035295 RepID=UPI0021D8C0F4|nr:FKBP-type peptidyl-prolyl cis-trans isomerase [Pseudomonas sp. RIT-PI-S]
MSRRLLFTLCLVAPFSLAEDAATSPHDLGYSLGASIGERLREDQPGLDVEALIDGLRQAYHDQPLALDEKRIRQILAAHEAEMGGAQQSSSTEAALMAERRFMAGERAKANMHELSNGVLYTELAPGQGEKPTANSRVEVSYKGQLPEGTIFDQNDQPQWFRLDSVIEGWKIALQQMPKGARWRVVIPSDQAYGAEGAGELIPPYTPLIFEIELRNLAN